MFFYPRQRTESVKRIPKVSVGHCLLVLATAAASITTSSAADTADAVPTTSLTVPFDDLNLNKHDDAVAMYDRLQRAAARVCATQRGLTLREKEQFSGCMARTMEASIARLDRPVLSRYAQARAGRPGAPRVARR